MVMQNRVKLATDPLVGGVVAGLRERIPEAEESAHQRSATWSKESQAFALSSATDHRLSLVLKDHRLSSDTTHDSPRISWWVHGLGRGPSRPAEPLDCRGLLRPAASEAAHALTVALVSCRPRLATLCAAHARTSLCSPRSTYDPVSLPRRPYDP